MNGVLSLLLLLCISSAWGFPKNLSCVPNHFPPAYYQKYYPVASDVAGKAWNVTCKQWLDTTGDLDWVKIPNGTFNVQMFSTFANGGVFSIFNVLSGDNIAFTENVTLYAVPDDPQFSPLEICVQQTNPDFSEGNFYVPLIEFGANAYSDTYINRYKTTAPAFYASQTEYFAISKNGKHMNNQLVRWNPKTAKTNFMLSCVYDAVDEFPLELGDWWDTNSDCCSTDSYRNKQPTDTVLQHIMKRYNLGYSPVSKDEELVNLGRFRVPRSIIGHHHI